MNDTPQHTESLPKESVNPYASEKEVTSEDLEKKSVPFEDTPPQDSAQYATDKLGSNQTTNPLEQENEMNYGPQINGAVKTLLSWHAPDRLYHKKGREYYVNVILIILIIEVILFLFHQFTLMILIVTLGFLVFALAVMPPNNIRYRISNQGIMLDESFFLWRELYDFYFMRREGEDVLHIRTADYYPGEIVLHLGEMHKDQLVSVLLPFLPYRESVQRTFMEKSGDWLSNTFPLDKLPSRS